MSKDLTQNLNGSLEDKIDRLIFAVQSMDSRLGNVEGVRAIEVTPGIEPE